MLLPPGYWPPRPGTITQPHTTQAAPAGGGFFMLPSVPAEGERTTQKATLTGGWLFGLFVGVRKGMYARKRTSYASAVVSVVVSSAAASSPAASSVVASSEAVSPSAAASVEAASSVAVSSVVASSAVVSSAGASSSVASASSAGASSSVVSSVVSSTVEVEVSLEEELLSSSEPQAAMEATTVIASRAINTFFIKNNLQVMPPAPEVGGQGGLFCGPAMLRARYLLGTSTAYSKKSTFV